MTYNPPPRPGYCACAIIGHGPGEHPTNALWTWQITSGCVVHWPRLPASVKIRILINEGVKL